MNRRITLTAVPASFLLVSLALAAGDAVAQSAKSLVGSWAIVSSETIDASGKKTPTFGPNPRGSLIFTPDGRYSLFIAQASLPKFAANSRLKGTADENKAIVSGTITHVGKYTVDEKDKSFTFHVESGTYPNWDGTAQKRSFTVAGNELKYSNPAASSGAGSADLVWKRSK